MGEGQAGVHLSPQIFGLLHQLTLAAEVLQYGDGVLEILSPRQFSTNVLSRTDCLLGLEQLMGFQLAAPPGPQEILLV